MTADLSGKYDYSGLRNALKENGVKTKYLRTAVNQVASENGVDNAKDLDKSKRITIANSIFEKYAATNPIDETLLPYAGIDGITDNGKAEKLPEIYNDDEYEVADYDDYYNFQVPSANTATEIGGNGEEAENGEETQGINYEQFRDEYAQMLLDGPQDKNAQNEFLKQVFNMADLDSNQLLDKGELSGAFYASELAKTKDTENTGSTPQGEEDPFGADMMQMDMSSDSFNPQG